MNVEVVGGRQELDEGTLSRLRERLIAERERLLHELTSIGASGDVADRAEPGDAADLATRHPPAEVEDELHRQHELRLEAIAHALERMDAGTYGTSVTTGEPIPLERLEVVPWAAE